MPQYDDEFYIRYIRNSKGSYWQTNYYRVVKAVKDHIDSVNDKNTLSDFMDEKEELLSVTDTFILSYNLYCHPHLILPLHHLFLQAITSTDGSRPIDKCFRAFYVTTKAD